MAHSHYEGRRIDLGDWSRYKSGTELEPFTEHAEQVILRAIWGKCYTLLKQVEGLYNDDISYFAAHRDGVDGVRFMIRGIPQVRDDERWFLDISQGFFREKGDYRY